MGILYTLREGLKDKNLFQAKADFFVRTEFQGIERTQCELALVIPGVGTQIALFRSERVRCE